LPPAVTVPPGEEITRNHAGAAGVTLAGRENAGEVPALLASRVYPAPAVSKVRPEETAMPWLAKTDRWITPSCVKHGMALQELEKSTPAEHLLRARGMTTMSLLDRTVKCASQPRELGEIVPPVDPGVAAATCAKLVLDAVFLGDLGETF
jgi:hypothetical protein